jgi:hypothetical protein
MASAKARLTFRIGLCRTPKAVRQTPGVIMVHFQHTLPLSPRMQTISTAAASELGAFNTIISFERTRRLPIEITIAT